MSKAQSTSKTCFDHNHMTPEEFGFYCYARAVSYESGIFYMDGRSHAKQFAATGKNRVYRIVDRLTSKGWFRQLTGHSRSKTGTFLAATYSVVSHEEWAAAHPNQCVVASPQNGTGQPVPKTGQAPVPKTQLTSPQNESDQSPKRNSPVPFWGHSIEKNVLKREIGKESEETLPRSSEPKPTEQVHLIESLLAKVIVIAKKVDSRAVFSGKARKEIRDAIQALAPPPTVEELEFVVRSAVEGMDDFALKNAGSALVAEIQGIEAQRQNLLDRRDEQAAIEAAEENAHQHFLREQSEHEERFREEREAAKAVEADPDALFGGQAMAGRY